MEDTGPSSSVVDLAVGIDPSLGADPEADIGPSLVASPAAGTGPSLVAGLEEDTYPVAADTFLAPYLMEGTYHQAQVEALGPSHPRLVPDARSGASDSCDESCDESCSVSQSLRHARSSQSPSIESYRKCLRCRRRRRRRG